jgi:hypothetical protein
MTETEDRLEKIEVRFEKTEVRGQTKKTEGRFDSSVCLLSSVFCPLGV